MLILPATIVLGISIYANTNITSENIKIQSNIESQYIEVSVDSVPLTIKADLETAYSDTELLKAYVNEKKEYKLELLVGNHKATVYTDVNGNW